MSHLFCAQWVGNTEVGFFFFLATLIWFLEARLSCHQLGGGEMNGCLQLTARAEAAPGQTALFIAVCLSGRGAGRRKLCHDSAVT